MILLVERFVFGKKVAEALCLKKRATKIFDDATFTIHKWHSNAPELEETDTNITEEQTFAKQQLGTADGGESSILGLRWDKRADQISVTIPSEAATTTKHYKNLHLRPYKGS